VPDDSDNFEIMDVAALGMLVKQRRTEARQSLRQAAADAGVSFSTMSRVEDGAQPDLATFTKLCAWLGVAPSAFFRTVSERRQNGLEEAVMHLAADPRLTAEAAERITSTLREMYNVLAASSPAPKDALAMHLRAATTMRPGVPERLASILQDMNETLTDLVDRGAV
jgi:transcriptional regulator with XRE-family HTH domain